MFQTLRRMLGIDPHAALKQALGERELPSFSHTTQVVLRQLRDPETSMASIGERLATDPGLSVGVLRLANRASNGLRRAIVDPAHAARLLGRAEIESLVISAAVQQALPTPASKRFHARRFWQQSALRASVAKGLAEASDRARARTAFTAALLQDMAVPLLVDAEPEGYHDLLEHDHSDLHEQEQARYGWDHTMVAGWVSAAWKLPDELTELIVDHHADHAPAAISIAEHALSDDDEPYVESARTLLGLSPERSLELLEKARVDAQELGAVLTA